MVMPVKEANKSNLPKAVFLAIVDGEYYKLNDGKRGMTKIDTLKDISNKKMSLH